MMCKGGSLLKVHAGKSQTEKWWLLDAARRLRERVRLHGELISFEEACRRMYRKGAEAEGVWSGPAITPE